MRSKFVLLIMLSLGALTQVSATQERFAGRITAALDERSRTVVQGHLHPLAEPRLDRGRVDPLLPLSRVTMMFKRSKEQQAALDSFLEEQQDPASRNYQLWLRPEEFADRFGLSLDDFNKVTSWLQSHGLRIDEISRSRTWIAFSGTAEQVESAFQTEIHHYIVDGIRHYAPAFEPSVPSALAGVVLGFKSLDDFRLKPRLKRTWANFTSSLSGRHFLTPDDVWTIYDIRNLYDGGIDGTGQTIAVMGQTDILISDIRTFRSNSGLDPNDPTVILVPGSSDPGIVSDDMAEADLDLEWAGAIAPKAQVIYVNSGDGVFDSLLYSIDQNIAPVLSTSYGACEANFSPSDKSLLVSAGQQANAQGMTIVAASGDAGATDCDGQSDDQRLARLGLAVDIPASLPYVTGVGGTTLYDAGNYWSNSNNGNSGSALSYIPEVPWNDTLVLRETGLAAGGGGRSASFSKPSWQQGRGVTSDGARDVPDVALGASKNVPYLICSAGSCVDGFRASDSTLFGVGGTSVGAPIFAGIVSLINQRMAASQGNLNPGLYRLASIAPNAFHDVATGGNWMPCQARTVDCPNGGLLGYAAARGYDLATGLGSVDAFKMVNSWPSLGR
jgi:subtilase family serine protease